MLSKRLETIISLVEPGLSLADVGTDHGYIPNQLLLQNLIPSAIAIDINEKPLNRAKELITSFNLLDKVDFRLGSGIEPIDKDEVDQVVIAGMGGEMIKMILAKDLDKTYSLKRFILQPMTHAEELREFLLENNFEIVKEIYVEEKDGRNIRFYPILTVKKGHMKTLTSFEKAYGYLPVLEINDDFKDYIQYELNQLDTRIQNMKNSQIESTVNRRLEFERRFDYLTSLNESIENSENN